MAQLKRFGIGDLVDDVDIARSGKSFFKFEKLSTVIKVDTQAEMEA